MKAVIALGFGAFFLSSLAIGLRLVWLARRNRELPELLIGFGILGIGPVGFAGSVFAILLGPGHPAAGACLLAGATVAVSLGALSSYVFNWRVFRRGDGLAKGIVFGAGLLFAVLFVVRLATGGFVLPVRLDAWFHLQSMAVTGCLLWGSGESLHYYALMTRRLRLGLADPIVTNRFLLWGLGIGSAGAGSLISTIFTALTGAGMQGLNWLTLSNSLFGLAAAVLMWIAFLPPAPYRRWIARPVAS
ncbi:MAG TPA: hypothetical protein VEG67_10125 [Myxococcota bacterium]|nr:hypothetical protein [Myxococcota bacterium]